jgi:hypothetical protein
LRDLSQNEYSCAHGAQINFGDLTPYLTSSSSSRSVLAQELAGWALGSGPVSAGHANARRIRISAGHRAARLQDQAHATGAEICARTVSRVPARQVGWRGFYFHPLAGSVGNAGLENCLVLCARLLVKTKIHLLPSIQIANSTKKTSCENCLLLCANLVDETSTSLKTYCQ